MAIAEDPGSIRTNAAAPVKEPTAGSIGTPLTGDATRVALLGGGELGKELAIELQRLGIEVTTLGSFIAGPAMQVAHRGHVVDLLDSDVLLNVLAIERPQVVVPVAGKIEPSVLGEIEDGGARVVPSALAIQLATDREILRRVLAEDLGLPTPKYRFAASPAELEQALAAVGLPAVVKPVRSVAGAGHSVVHSMADAASAWQSAVAGGWFSSDDFGDREPRVIVEEFVPFEAELVVFVVRAVAPSEGPDADELIACPPIQVVEDEGFAEAWTPPALAAAVLQQATELALTAVSALPGLGVFAVELLVTPTQVLVSEVAPRIVSAGLVTLASWDLSIFALQARAILGLPVSPPRAWSPAAARALWVSGDGNPTFTNLQSALASYPGARVLFYGKSNNSERRSVGLVLATDDDAAAARNQANLAAATIIVQMDDGRDTDT